MIKLTDKYYIGSDEYNPFILYERKVVKEGKTKGTEKFFPIGYYDYLNRLCDRLVKRELAEINTTEIFTLGEFINRYRDEIEKIILSMQLERKSK